MIRPHTNVFLAADAPPVHSLRSTAQVESGQSTSVAPMGYVGKPVAGKPSRRCQQLPVLWLGLAAPVDLVWLELGVDHLLGGSLHGSGACAGDQLCGLSLSVF